MFENNQVKDKIQPFALYIMKLLHSKIDIANRYNAFFKEKNPWLVKYPEISINLELSEQKFNFAFISDKSYLNDKQEFMITKFDKIDKYLKGV